jgi:hypothetical protein
VVPVVAVVLKIVLARLGRVAGMIFRNSYDYGTRWGTLYGGGVTFRCLVMKLLLHVGISYIQIFEPLRLL